MLALIKSSLTLLVGILIGFLSKYAGKKGENLATHEDIDKLVDQVAAVTSTTKKIEAEISSAVWNRQRHWELKREVLFEATKRIAEIDDALLSLDTVFQVEFREQKQDDDLPWVEPKHKAVMAWKRAATRFSETRLLVAIVCGRESKEAFDNFGQFTDTLGAEICKKNLEIYKSSVSELALKLFAVRAAIRTELCVDDPEDSCADSE